MRPRLRSFTSAFVAGFALAIAAASGCGESPATTPVTMRLSVTGMHCDGCEQAICDKVLKVEGVASCTASHEDESVEVVAPPAQRPQIEAAITRLGYRIGQGEPSGGDAPNR